ncbi:DUF1801 domain-containing protein [Antrihabitans sp. YC3-6]|uniref:DUF1801 domain-containing protein n=1 Tax=Antrihabitans stalagmiti TaxID=2799499 RepID=A0A934NM95_9NOCA|nr:DUF1801 domain-containing protein [Antrihabitans stalagmiti]MBJ8337841.1 DUF1801 domain-containing protein [Antrihabitans stalagmiti]
MATTKTVTDYLDEQPDSLRAIGIPVQELIDSTMPPGVAAIWHGHATWSLGGAPGKTPVCLLKVYPKHITLGFWRGQEIEDVSGRLAPSGSGRMAVVKLRTSADIDIELFEDWLRQACALDA